MAFLKKMRELLKDGSHVVVNENRYDEDGYEVESKYGRLEMRKTSEGTVYTQIFGSMDVFPPQCEIILQDKNYDPIDNMCKNIVKGNLGKATSEFMKHKAVMTEVTVRVKSCLTSRMADVEYPFLHYLKHNGIYFALLNPNKGTIYRASRVFQNVTLPIFVTCSNYDPNYEQYMDNLLRANERGWPVKECTVQELDRNVLFYSGFTARKTAYSGIKFVGYEINPSIMVQTFRESIITHDEKGEGDFVSIRRAEDYTYEEFYPYNPYPHHRYCADVLEEQIKIHTGYMKRPYQFLYNVISSDPLPGLRTRLDRRITLQVMLGLTLRSEGGKWLSYSHYSGVDSEIDVGDFLVAATNVYRVSKQGQAEYAALRPLVFKNPYVNMSPYEKYFVPLMKYINSNRDLPLLGREVCQNGVKYEVGIKSQYKWKNGSVERTLLLECPNLPYTTIHGKHVVPNDQSVLDFFSSHGFEIEYATYVEDGDVRVACAPEIAVKLIRTNNCIPPCSPLVLDELKKIATIHVVGGADKPVVFSLDTVGTKTFPTVVRGVPQFISHRDTLVPSKFFYYRYTESKRVKNSKKNESSVIVVDYKDHPQECYAKEGPVWRDGDRVISGKVVELVQAVKGPISAHGGDGRFVPVAVLGSKLSRWKDYLKRYKHYELVSNNELFVSVSSPTNIIDDTEMYLSAVMDAATNPQLLEFT